MVNHYEEAEHWLREADSRTSIEAGRECLFTALIHAVLALVDVQTTAAEAAVNAY